MPMFFLRKKTPAFLRLPALAEEIPVAFRPHRRSRKYVLKVAPDGTVRITIPPFGSRRFALRFAEENGAWLAGQIALRRQGAAPWENGREFLFAGIPVPAVLEEAGGRRFAVWGGRRVRLRPSEDLRAAVVRSLREVAARELPLRLAARAAAFGTAPSRVVVRDQRARWGSCSARGVISLNWRLVQMPPAVADSILLHELAHLRELNHSPRFWKIVAGHDPAWREAKAWLAAHRSALL